MGELIEMGIKVGSIVGKQMKLSHTTQSRRRNKSTRSLIKSY